MPQTDWEQRLEVLTLKNQGWSYNQIARKLDKSPQWIHQLYTKVKSMTIEEIEQMLDNHK